MRPPGSLFGLAVLAVPVKPLAYIAADYARSYRHEKVEQNIHDIHPLSGEGPGNIISAFDNVRKADLFLSRGRLSLWFFFCHNPRLVLIGWDKGG